MKYVKPRKNQEFRDLMLELVRLFAPDTYVEIGVHKGYTFKAIAPKVKRAVAVDINDMGHIPDWHNVEKYQMSSGEFAKVWSGPIDFLFIDADHDKKAVLHDLDALVPYMTEGTGLILLHDTHPVAENLLRPQYCHNAWEAAWTIRKQRKYGSLEIVTLPGPVAGLSIIRKARRHLAWKQQ